MKKAPLKKVLEKLSDIMIDLGKASILAGFALLFIDSVRWFEGVGSIILGVLLIAGGLRLTFYTETLGEENV